MTHKEDWSTGSLAAAFGGISCVFDMPNTIPQTTTSNSVKDKIKNAKQKSYVDFGVYSGVSNENIDDIEKISKFCNGFKIYLGNTTGGLMFDKQFLWGVLKTIGQTGKPVMFHAEDEECLIKNRSVEKNLADHLHFRPSSCEEISIKDIFTASQGLSSNIHICHLSSCEGLELLKNRPRNISCGITPHHSLLSVEKDMGTPAFYKVNPPVRTSFDKEALFNAIKNGLVDIIESDHAPHTCDEKAKNFNETPSGLPGVETMYPLFLYLVKKEALSIQRLISMLCVRPANLMGVSKGRLEAGFDADFIVVDLKDDCKIKSENLHSKCGWSPFEDWPAIFPENVFIRGEKLIDENEIQVSQGFGNFIGA
jgi:dihydroorotase